MVVKQYISSTLPFRSSSFRTREQPWLVGLLKVVGIMPAVLGFLYGMTTAWNMSRQESWNLTVVKAFPLTYYLASFWCLLAGFWSWWLINELHLRWLHIYGHLSALLRLAALVLALWIIPYIFAAFTSNIGLQWMGVCLLLAGAHVQRLTSNGQYGKVGDFLEEGKRAGENGRASIFRYILLPGCLFLLITSGCLLNMQTTLPYRSDLISTQSHFAHSVGKNLTQLHPANTRILMLVLSSWTPRGLEKRQEFRETTLRLAPPLSAEVSFDYRFVIGEPPSAQVHRKMGARIEEESKQHGDILIVPASDGYNDLSKKLHKALVWSSGYDFDYLVKTDDDIFVRLDTVSRELLQVPKQPYYWRGLAYHDIPPIRNPNNKNAEFDYQLPMFPQFTAGAMYILSQDVVALLASEPRLYTRNEDQNLGVWLYPYNIRPIHDKRIQQADVCEDDMIAKHFSDTYEPRESRHKMLANVLAGRRMCEGFRQQYCAYCYPCKDRVNHWREWGYDCDELRGISLLDSKPSGSSDLPQQARDPLEPPTDDRWIVPGLLNRETSTLSETEEWHLLHWVCWTTDPSTFGERHFKALELIWAHTPRAVVMVITTTLPEDFFSSYTQNGYRVHVVHVNRDLMLEYRWFLGQNSEQWVREWDRWSRGRYFFSHLTDYMRYMLLYKYGGMYMDMDALWLRAPPAEHVEFIGADRSDVRSDTEWTLDSEGTYLAPGVMRFRRGWRVFREVAEAAFSSKYSADCFNCVGPRAITTHVRAQRPLLESNGFTILPTRVLYPLNYVEVDRTLKPSIDAGEELRAMEKDAWSLHLFGKMTNGLPVQAGSVVDLIMRRFSLGMPHSELTTLPDGKRKWMAPPKEYPFNLVGPSMIYLEDEPDAASLESGADSGEDSEGKRKVRAAYTSHPTTDSTPGYYGGKSIDDIIRKPRGAFQGLDLIFVQGGPAQVKSAAVKVYSLGNINGPTFRWGNRGSELSADEVKLRDATRADVNALLSQLNVVRNSGKLVIEVQFGSQLGKVEVDVREDDLE
ncbi:uncharacterized protein VTP21DRAFT_5832 [Calcarisporiella thermophila]|uniref:uncharacterized protein n=1 Tax=Calcarisporiella thermophila TaxID=911321 RepID=UPI0037441F78